MTLRLPLAKSRFATFVSVYSTPLCSSVDVKDRFYDTLHSTLRRISQDDKIILLGDFNARVGTNHDIWHGVIGHHCVGNMNSRCLRLLSLCSELGFVITKTFFQLRDMHKTSLMHPRSKHWHIIYYVFVFVFFPLIYLQAGTRQQPYWVINAKPTYYRSLQTLV